MTAAALIAAATQLSHEVGALSFRAPVAHVYNPLDYAWGPHLAYLRRYADGDRHAVFLGMNPGPYGMMQTGVPFGEVAAVRHWMGIDQPVTRPALEHPKRPIQGFDCTRSEVSGRRLWGWAQTRFGTAQAFFERNFVLNYCPLVFLEASGKNFTPDRLPAGEAIPLQAACDAHLVRALLALSPTWAIGIGGFALKRLQRVIQTPGIALGGAQRQRLSAIRIAQILHPSPASPAANRGWQAAVDSTLSQLGVYE